MKVETFSALSTGRLYPLMAFLACKKGEIYLLYDGGFMDVVVL
jgi:hypothetical protein